MHRLLLSASCSLLLLPVMAGQAAVPAPPETMPIPTDYREWQYLTSGLDMSYKDPAVAPVDAAHSIFDNVFVNRDAWAGFKQSGTWPNGTVLVLENRTGEGKLSINKQGKAQNAEVTGLELHAKVNNQWAFYVREDDGLEHLIAKPASCYTCHEAHGAADTTFAQFYPTALPIAKNKGTLNPEYLKELATPPAK